MEDLSDFDLWYQDVIEILSLSNKRAPYKMAWFQLYEDNYSPEEASVLGPFIEI